jgi:hypothetical protein
MVRSFAFVMGIVFLLIGVLGFIPGLTPDGRLLGIFAVNTPHNIIHILSGIIGIWAAGYRETRLAIGYAWYLVIAYGLVTLLGFVMTPDRGMLFNMIHINRADNWLHLLITFSALFVAINASRERMVYR